MTHFNISVALKFRKDNNIKQIKWAFVYNAKNI